MSASETTAGGAAAAPAGAPVSSEMKIAGRAVSLEAMIVAGLTALGLALRLAVIDQSLFGDELATWWDVTTHSLTGVISTVHSDAEITPPLYFVLAKLATYISVTPEMLRLPSLIAGTATIPMTYLLGAKTVGRRAGLVGAAVVTLSPFLIYYSSEARGYQVMIALLLASSLCLLRGLDRGGAGWWIAYAALSCAAMLTHYTMAFALAGQALWALWAHPGARRAVLLANLGAALAFMPWITGFIADFNSPTTDILSELQPFTWEGVRLSVEHFTIGYAYALLPLGKLPGHFALVLLGLGVAVALGAAGLVWVRSGAALPRRIAPGLALVIVLAVATPLGEAIVSALSTNLFGTRNLAAAWPGFALALGALLVSSRRAAVWATASVLVLAAFAIGAIRMLGESAKRPDYEGPAAVIRSEAAPGDAVIEQVFSPGPLSSLDSELGSRYPIIRIGVPQQREHPFTILDRVAPPKQVAAAATRAARPDGRIFLAGSPTGRDGAAVAEVLRRLAPDYRVTRRTSYGGLYTVELFVLEPRDSAAAG